MNALDSQFDEQANLEIALKFSNQNVREIVQKSNKIRRKKAARIANSIRQQIADEIQLLELADMILNTFQLIISDRQEHSIPTIWVENNSPRKMLLGVLLTNISDTLYSIRQLVRSGAGSQSRVLLRYCVETCDITLAILGDERIFDIFSHFSDDDALIRANWHRYLSPSKLRAVLQEIESELADGDVSLQIQNIRKSTYDWLSQCSHVNACAYIAGHGHEDYQLVARSVLGSACNYMFLFLLVSAKLLLERHKWFDREELDSRVNAQQCDFQEKLCFILIDRYKTRYIQYIKDKEGTSHSATYP